MSLVCPNCGGWVVYNPQSETVVCEFCGWETAQNDFSGLEGRREYDKENAESTIDSEREIQSNPEPVQCTDDFEEFMEAKIYHCKSCGAELMLTGTEASTFCGFCGASAIVFEHVSKEIRPKWIIPFKLTPEEALDSIKEHFSKGEYIPSKIRELTVDKVYGIYMPYWLFDTFIRRSMIVETCTHKGGTFQYIRDASCCYKKVTLDASLRLNNEMSRRLEPFRTDELVAFDVAYLSGYYADRFDVTKEALKKANVCRCRDYLDAAILDTCPYVNKKTVWKLSNYQKKDIHEEYEILNAEYVLLPAYFVNIKYDTGRETVIVNGQTGKVVANLPYEKKQIVKKFIKNALITCPIFMLLTYGILSLKVYPVFLILAAITGFVAVGGISDYKKYKLGKSRMSALSMKSYINDREGTL